MAAHVGVPLAARAAPSKEAAGHQQTVESVDLGGEVKLVLFPPSESGQAISLQLAATPATVPASVALAATLATVPVSLELAAVPATSAVGSPKQFDMAAGDDDAMAVGAATSERS